MAAYRFPFRIYTATSLDNGDLIVGCSRNTDEGVAENTWRRLAPKCVEVWRVEASRDPAELSSSDGNIFSAGYDIRPNIGVLARLDPDTGATIWERTFRKAYGMVRPIVCQGVVLAASQKQVFGIDAKRGKTLWKLDESTVDATPAAWPAEGCFTLGSQCGRILMVEADSGKVIWTREGETGRSNPRLIRCDNELWVGYLRGPLLQLNPMDGSIIFEVDVEVGINLVADKEQLYVNTYSDDAEGHRIGAIQRATGQLKWEVVMPCKGDGSSILSPQELMLVEEQVWVSTLAGPVWICDKTSGEVIQQRDDAGTGLTESGLVSWDGEIWTQREAELSKLS